MSLHATLFTCDAHQLSSLPPDAKKNYPTRKHRDLHRKPIPAPVKLPVIVHGTLRKRRQRSRRRLLMQPQKGSPRRSAHPPQLVRHRVHQVLGRVRMGGDPTDPLALPCLRDSVVVCRRDQETSITKHVGPSLHQPVISRCRDSLLDVS